MVKNTKIAHYLGILILAYLFVFSFPAVSTGKEIIFFFTPLLFIVHSALNPSLSLVINIFIWIFLYRWLGKAGLSFIPAVIFFSWLTGCLIYYSFRASRVILALTIIASIAMSLFFKTIGKDLLPHHRENFARIEADLLSYYREKGLEEEKVKLFQDAMGRFNRIVVRAFPSIMVISIAIVVSVNYSIARYFLVKAGYYKPPSIPPLSQWRIPDAVIWVFIGASLCIWLGGRFTSDIIYNTGLNFMILALTAYLVQGVILLNFFLKKMKWPYLSRIIVYLFLLIQPVFLIAIVLWGIMEVWFNFRKLEIKG